MNNQNQPLIPKATSGNMDKSFEYMYKSKRYTTVISRKTITQMLDNNEVPIPKQGWKNTYRLLFRDVKVYNKLAMNRSVKVDIVPLRCRAHTVSIGFVTTKTDFTVKERVSTLGSKLKFIVASWIKARYNSKPPSEVDT